MDTVGMESLLRAREEKLRGELRADDLIEKNRSRSVERLREAYGDIQVLLTGGDAEPLWGKGLLAIDNCTIHPWLVMNGLNEIINANEK